MIIAKEMNIRKLRSTGGNDSAKKIPAKGIRSFIETGDPDKFLNLFKINFFREILEY